MSLIADALKKAQAAQLGRRYRRPEAADVLASQRRAPRKTSLSRFGPVLSPTLWVGLGAAVFLFVLLSTYFLVVKKPAPKGPVPAPKEERALILAPPPPVAEVEPLDLEKKAVAGKPPEKTPGKEQPQQLAEAAKPSPPRGEAQKKVGEAKSEQTQVRVSSDLSQEVRYHFNLALSYQEERNFPAARREYERVVEMWPLHAEARNNLGVVYKELGMYGEALSEFNKALALNPRYSRAHHNLGVIYQLQGRWREAIKQYETALSLDRSHLSSYNNLGLVYRSQGRLDEAREVLEKALALSSSFPHTHYNLALVLEELGELERARFHYQKFTELADDLDRALVERVRDHLRLLARR